jgi:hypothetical protein
MWLSLLASISFVLSVFIFLPDRHYRDDILAYCRNAEDGNGIFLPNHLLYIPLVIVIWRLLSFLIPEVRAIEAANLLSILFGIPTILLFYWFNFKITSSHIFSLCFTLAFAFTYNVWSYSSSGETYIIPTFFTLLAFYYLSGRQELNAFNTSMVGLMIAGAALIHQSYALLVLPVGFYIFQTGKRPSLVVLLLLISSLVCFFVYAVVGFSTLSIDSISELVVWARGYVGNPAYGQLEFTYQALQNSVLGFMNSMVDLKSIRDAIIAEEKLLYTMPVIIALLGIAYIGLYLLTGIFVFISKYRHFDHHLKSWVNFLLIHLIVFSIIAIYWLPYDHKFWMPVLFPLLTLINISFTRLHRNFKRIALGFTCNYIIVIWLLNAIYGKHSLEFVNEYNTARTIAGKIPDQSLVLIPDSHIWKYFEYFFPDRNVAFDSLYNHDGSKEFKSKLIEEIRGYVVTGNVYVSADEIKPNALRQAPYTFLSPADYIEFYSTNILAKEVVFQFSAFGSVYEMYRILELSSK